MDIDIDLCSAKRPLILKKIKEERGELNVVQVATFGQCAPKAAIAAACKGYRSPECPQGIDIDISRYLSSMIPVERGFPRSISNCVFGNEEEGLKPIMALKNGIDEYPGLLDIILEIEGVIVRSGQHASGIMMYNNSPYDTTALMRSPNGDVITQFDLHKSEDLGDVKFDYLITEVSDKLSIAIDLLIKDGYFSECKTKREVYNKYFHPEVIDWKDEKLWNSLASGQVLSVFQFNTAIGKDAIRAIQPKNPTELTAANALIRLTAPEGQERPFDRYVRFKNDISLWYREMDERGLTKEEQRSLEPYYLQDYGVPASQEALMRMVMDEKISNFTLAEANTTRKVIGKKQIKQIPVIKEKFLKACPRPEFGEYAWETMMLPQMTYSFSINHATPYSFVGIQTVLIATYYPQVYWNTACLIVNSSSTDLAEKDLEDSIEDTYDSVPIDDIGENDDEDDEDSGDSKKTRTPNYGKISTAIGEMASYGIKVAPPNINLSSYSFTPDAANNQILYGMSGINKIGDSVVKEIVQNRPYSSIQDFLEKVKVTKPQVVNLIKSGAFDTFGSSRQQIMEDYIDSITDKKKNLNLQNMPKLIAYELLPQSLEFEIKVFNFNKFIKKECKRGDKYFLSDYPLEFYRNNFDEDLLVYQDEGDVGVIDVKQWDKIYSKKMDTVRTYIKDNKMQLLNELNQALFNELFIKYCNGSISKWEMDSVSYYSHEHELLFANTEDYGIVNFYDLPEEPRIATCFRTRDGKDVPLYEITRIAGTIIDKDKVRKTVSLLTTEGVIGVRIFGNTFSFYDKQISEVGPDGKKKILEKSMLARGNKIVVTGIRKGPSTFIAKKYKNTPYELIEEIVDICEDGSLVLRTRE